MIEFQRRRENARNATLQNPNQFNTLFSYWEQLLQFYHAYPIPRFYERFLCIGDPELN